MEIRIGDFIRATLFNGKDVYGKIETIEICKEGEKYGKHVKSCHTNKHVNGVVDLSCGNWCYFDQIQSVITKNNLYYDYKEGNNVV